MTNNTDRAQNLLVRYERVLCSSVGGVSTLKVGEAGVPECVHNESGGASEYAQHAAASLLVQRDPCSETSFQEHIESTGADERWAVDRVELVEYHIIPEGIWPVVVVLREHSTVGLV